MLTIPSVCGNLTQIYFDEGARPTARERVSFWEDLGFRGYTPSPPTSESLDWRGSCKNGPQNLEGKELRGQNIDNKGLTALFAVATCTASALTIFCFLAGGRQGQMSHEECGLCGFHAVLARG